MSRVTNTCNRLGSWYILCFIFFVGKLVSVIRKIVKNNNIEDINSIKLEIKYRYCINPIINVIDL